MADNSPTTTPYVPWGLHPLPKFVVEEIKQRSQEYGMNPTEPGNMKGYSGPKTAWIRVCSNGKGKDLEGTVREGFVLGGVHGFNDSYGFNDKQKIHIGLDVKGDPHVVNIASTMARTPPNKYDTVPDFPHRPPPSLNSIECELQGSANSSFPSLCRRVRINFKCNSLAQLNYLIPYFFTPRITVLVEWGWNNYNPASLADLKDVKNMANMFVDPKNIYDRIELSRGNYDAAIGFITDFGYNLNAEGGYDCFTSITNANFLLEGQAIQNQTAQGSDGAGKTTQKKTLKEFMTLDLDNLNADTPAMKDMLAKLKIKYPHRRMFAPTKAQGRGSANGNKKWISMGLMADILNAFCSANMVDFNGNPVIANDPTRNSKEKVPVAINKLDIKDTQISANPALKSINPDIIFPNQFSPRFVSHEKPIPSNKNIMGVKINDTAYATLFPKLAATLMREEYGLSREFDDLYKLVNAKNPSGFSFPMYEDWTEPGQGTLNAGYWGYLTDVYVSVDIIKSEIEKNDTVMKFLESMLQHISEAMCNIAQLKLISPEHINGVYSVMDANLSYITNSKEAEELEKISVGSLGGAFLRSAQFEIKLSAEMANQMVFQSANPNREIPPPPGFATVNNDPKKNDGSNRFSEGDRLFNQAFIPQSVNSVANENKRTLEEIRAAMEEDLKNRDERAAKKKADAEAVTAAKNKRNFVASSKLFYTCEDGTEKYILAETEPDFIKYLLTALDDPKAAYLNNAIMPGTTFTMDILGISGITYLSQFTLDHVPDTYNAQNAVWQISDIKHVVDSKIWATSITAQVRPLTFISTKT